MLQREESATSHIAVCRGDSQHGTATYQTKSWRVCAAEILAFRVRKQQERGPKASKQATRKPCRAQPCCGKKQRSKSGRRPKVNKGIIRRQMLVAEEQSVVFCLLRPRPRFLMHNSTQLGHTERNDRQRGGAQVGEVGSGMYFVREPDVGGRKSRRGKKKWSKNHCA